MESSEQRTELILTTLTDAFEPLMKADAQAFRTKFRKMAADPFAFYRGSACVFYADMRELEDRWADERTSRVWIHGDLHAENFGTYMNSEGVLTFDVNDFDEAYVGHFSWDLRRFVASLALMGWQKALPEDAVRELAAAYLRAYVERVHVFLPPSSALHRPLWASQKGVNPSRTTKRPAQGGALRVELVMLIRRTYALSTQTAYIVRLSAGFSLKRTIQPSARPGFGCPFGQSIRPGSEAITLTPLCRPVTSSSRRSSASPPRIQ